ncbi:hypothetical protein GCM10025794_20970 [Massilia kyonggiensis]
MIPEFRVNLISGVDEDSGFWVLGSGLWARWVRQTPVLSVSLGRYLLIYLIVE